MEQEIEKSKKNVLLIILVILVLLVVGGAGCYFGFYLANNENNSESDLDKNDGKENNTQAIDQEEASNKTVIKMDMSAETTTEKPEYYSADNFYKDGYLGYYTNEYSIFGNDVYPDNEKGEFVKLYQCENKEYGKCGYAEPMGVDGTYNLEEGLKLAAEGPIMIDKRYIFIYDGAVYQESEYSSFFSNESPLIIYDIKNDKELGRYAAIYNALDSSEFGFITVDLNNNYGVIKLNNGQITQLVPFEYDYIGRLYGMEQFMLVKDGQYYYYDSSTNTKTGPFNNQIASYSEDFIVTNEGNYLGSVEKNYRLYTTDGKKLLVDAGNKYIDLIDDKAIVIDKNNELNIYNVKGEKLLDNSIKDVKGTYHIRCCDALMAYSFSVEGKVMTLTVNRSDNDKLVMTTYSINLDSGDVKQIKVDTSFDE